MRDVSLLRVSRRLVLAATTSLTLTSDHAFATEPLCRYPRSWTGVWRVDRCLEMVEGNVTTAEVAWTVSGGTGAFVPGHREEYGVRFLLDDEVASVADWAFEICSRCALPDAAVSWDLQDELKYQRAPRAVTAVCVEARTDLRTLSQFGAIERWRTVPGGGGEELVLEVRRTYLPVNDLGNIEGRELIRTYSAPPGIKVDLQEPTSTSRSSLTLRPLERRLWEPIRRPTWNAG